MYSSQTNRRQAQLANSWVKNIAGLIFWKTEINVVHTARRYYRLNGSVRPWDWLREVGNDHSEPETWLNLVI